MSMSSLGGVPRVTNARLDKVKPKVVFFFAMPASIGRARVNFQARSARLHRKVSYIDPSLFRMIEGLRAFPRAMTKQERKHPRLTTLHDRVAGDTAAPRISRPNSACRSIKQVLPTILSWLMSREAKARKAMLR